MPVAIQEDLLPGRSIQEKFEHARALGLNGIEFWARDLAPKVSAIAEAIEQTGVAASSINLGRQSRFLDPHPLERERALADLRQAIADAVDLGAATVVFVPHYFGAALPDLMPWMSAVELEIELLFMHLRTLSDFADALGVSLCLKPVNHYETHFMTRVEHAAMITRRLNHPRVRIAANTFHMALEERDLAGVLREHADQLGLVYLSDSNQRLPGGGLIDFKALGAALNETGYTGWYVLEAGDPGANAERAPHLLADLPASLDLLREAGIS